MATLLSKVLPLYQPNTILYEVGSYTLHNNGDIFLVASPDGEGRNGSQATCVFELKCPFGGKQFTPTVHYSIPKYYVPQLLAEMNAASAVHGSPINNCIYLCWSNQSSTAFHVRNNPDLWNIMRENLVQLYGCDTPVKPKKKIKETSSMQIQVEEFLCKNVSFLGEFPSVTASMCDHGDDNRIHIKHQPNQQASKNYFIVDMQQTLLAIKKSLEDVHVLTRPMATDIMVFMLSDLDRTKQKATPMALPVAYGLSGKRLTTDVCREMLADVRHTVKQYGINVLTEGFDGQMYKLAVTDKKMKPLTLLQQQKSLWTLAQKMSKQELLQLIVKDSDIGSHDDQLSLEKAVTRKITFIDTSRKLMSKIAVKSKKGLHAIHISTELRKTLQSALQPKTTNKNETTLREAPTDTVAGSFMGDMDTEQLSDDVMTELLDVELALITNISNEQPPDLSNDAPVTDITFEADSLLGLVAESEEIDSSHQFGLDDTKEDELGIMLSALKTNTNDKIRNKWLTRTKEDLAKMLGVADDMKHMTVPELKLCFNITDGGKRVQEKPHYKANYINYFSLIYGQGQTVPVKSKPATKKSPPPLKLLIKRQLGKSTLAAIYCHMKWCEIKDYFYKTSIFPSQFQVEGFTETFEWTTTVDVDDDGKPLVRLLDFHHLPTNTRSHCCRSGYVNSGIKKEAWHRVALDEKQNKTGLNAAFVEDLVDIQSNQVAQLTFSEDVEKVMIDNQDVEEANFCKLIREWYQSVDQRGIPAIKRVQNLLNLRAWLLKQWNPESVTFPPPTSYVNSTGPL